MAPISSKVCLSSIVSDVSFTSQHYHHHHHHHHPLHPKTLHLSRIEISFPFTHPTHHIQLLNFCNNSCSLLPNAHRLVVYSTSSNDTANFSNYLVNSLGFSEEQSLSISAKLIRFREGRVPKKVTSCDFQITADTVVNLLQETGLDLPHIRNIVNYDPRILFSDAENTLRPRIQILQELGFSGFELARLTSKNPGVLACSLDSAVKTLRTVLCSDENVASVIKRSNRKWLASVGQFLIPNVELLESYGVPSLRIRWAILSQPTAFMRSTRSFQDILNRVEEKWEVPRDSTAFIYAVKVLSFNSEETIDSKCRVFKSFGWSDSDVHALMRVNPRSFLGSEAKIKNSLEFLMNELGYTPSYLVSASLLFYYNVENRLAPRHRVLQILKGKRLVKADYKLCSAAVLSESDFVKKFIQPFKEELPHLHEIYVNHEQRKSKLSSTKPQLTSLAAG